MIKIKDVIILSFSVIATIAKINTKIKIKVVNKIPNNRLKFVCAKFNYRFRPLHIGTSATHNLHRICHNACVLLLYVAPERYRFNWPIQNTNYQSNKSHPCDTRRTLILFVPRHPPETCRPTFYAFFVYVLQALLMS